MRRSPPVIYDIATSMVAEGKVFVAKNKGVAMPEGHLVDKDGRPTTDPNDLYAGGSLLPFGGHKGSGLAIVAELLAGALTGAGSSQRREKTMTNTMCSIYVDPGKLPDRSAFEAEARALVDWVKASPRPTPRARCWCRATSSAGPVPRASQAASPSTIPPLPRSPRRRFPLAFPGRRRKGSWQRGDVSGPSEAPLEREAGQIRPSAAARISRSGWSNHWL